MDRLLRLSAQDLRPAGDIRVTTARGTVFTFGDGTGQPVAVRFTTRAAEWGILLDPELKFGEAYMDGTLRGRARLDRRRARDHARPEHRRAALGAAARPAALPPPAPAASSIRARARGATSRIITISTAGSIRCSSTPTGNTAAPISRTPDAVARRRPARQEAPSRRQAAARRAASARARHRLRLGRARALSRRILPAPT